MNVVASGGSCTIREVSQEQEFWALKERWHGLEEANHNPFLTFEWLSTWWRHFGQGNRLCILLAEQDGQTVGLAPLMLAARRGYKRLQFIGQPFSDYSDFLITGDRERTVRALVGQIKSALNWDQVVLDGILDSSPNLQLLRTLWSDKSLLSRWESPNVAPYLPIQSSWEEYLGTVDKRLRSDTARQFRRLAQLGEVGMRRCAAPEEASRILDILAQQKASRYQATGARDIMQDGRVLGFFKEAAQKLWSRELADVVWLALNGKPIAIHFGFKSQDRYFYYMPSFDASYSVYSVGRLLNYRLLEMAFEQKLREFDFLAGADTYKRDWTSQERLLHRLVSYHKSPKGLALFAAQELAWGKVRRSQKIRAFVRRWRQAQHRSTQGQAT